MTPCTLPPTRLTKPPVQIRIPWAFALVILVFGSLQSTLATAAPPKVVASFSILGDLVAAVGGEDIELTVLVGPDADAHVYQPTPENSRELKAADVLFMNGLGFEVWMDRLVSSSGFAGRTVIASEGVEPLQIDASSEGGEPEGTHSDHDHGEVDPHAWQDAGNVVRYIENIRDALIALDAENAQDYRQRAEAYITELRQVDAAWRDMVNGLPQDRRLVITSHDAFGYLARAYGLRFEAPQGISTDAEASAADVAALIRQIRAQGGAAVFVENMADDRIIKQIQRETGARVGGTLYADALSAPEGVAPTYLTMMRHNLSLMGAALR